VDDDGLDERARRENSATLLPNGKVLISAGFNSAGTYLSTSELYDPAAGTWTTTGSLNAAYYEHTATLLPNGKVLVTGASTAAALSRRPNSTTRRPGRGRRPAR